MIDPTMFGDFPKADPVERGCGEREPGGVYAEAGLSPHGRPLEDFLIDPPLPIPDGLDLPNKPQLWQRMMPSGQSVRDEQGQPVYDVLIWVGEEFYPYCPDFLEEVRRYGASRRLNPNLDLELLSRNSHMLLAHPRVINTLWQAQRSPVACAKNVPGHAAPESEAEEDEWAKDTQQVQTASSMLHSGPCLFKVWELLPIEAAQSVIEVSGESPLCLRCIGSTTYSYRPTGESEDGLAPGLFATLPITGFALIQFDDGSVNEKARHKMLAAIEAHGTHAVPFYASER
jgi:hypothetical protein